MAEEAQPGTPKEQCPSHIVTGVPDDLESQEKVSKSESSGDKGVSNDAPAVATEDYQGEDDPMNKPIEQAPVLISEEGAKRRCK